VVERLPRFANHRLRHGTRRKHPHERVFPRRSEKLMAVVVPPQSHLQNQYRPYLVECAGEITVSLPNLKPRKSKPRGFTGRGIIRTATRSFEDR
jgi:hypothetical protein